MKRMQGTLVASVWLLATLVASAAAQPLPGDDEEPGDVTPPPVDPPPPPPPPVETKVAPAVEPEPEVTPVVAEPRATRPTAFSIAIGLGYDLPADLQAPNITSVRFRLPSGLTFEPRVELARSGSTTDTGTPPDTETTTTSTELGVLARHPLMSNGKVDFEIAGGFSLARSVVNPDMADNDTTTTSFGIFYGIAVGYWFTPHVYLTLTGLNPILSTSSRSEEMGPTLTVETSSTGVGLVFDPNVFAMLHLYL